MITIDGSMGEGGGQILRTALSLSLITGKELCLHHIRSGRSKPGLQNQHLGAVQAAAAVGQAEVEGAALGSMNLVFKPQTIQPGEYAFALRTAGSTTLILQTILPALMTASGPSALVLEGGTHNPLAPPFEFVAKTFLPLLERMGPKVKMKLDRHGFYPVGGGKIRVTIEPVTQLNPIQVIERGDMQKCRCTAVLANLPDHIAERELNVLKRKLRLTTNSLRTELVKSPGMGNVLLAELQFPDLTEVIIGFGEKGLRAEVVAHRLAKDVERYLESNVPVGEHLADQLLLPMALAGGGAFVTTPLSPHALTNIEVIQQFLPVPIAAEPIDEGRVRVRVG